MPLYEYMCPRCTRKFEELVSANDPTPVCPDCKSNQVTKLISTSNFELKGSGWYKDGYGLKKP
jgi:putative FmdB family regulatory protein